MSIEELLSGARTLADERALAFAGGIQVPAPREVVDRINAASAEALENARWAETDEEHAYWQRRHCAAKERTAYLFEPVSIFREVPCVGCGKPARDVCSGIESRAKCYDSQQPRCPACRECYNRVAAFLP